MEPPAYLRRAAITFTVYTTMISSAFLKVSAAIAWTATVVFAAPTWQFETSTGEGLIQLLESRAPVTTLNFTASANASIIYPSSPDFVNATHRWSDWHAPEFIVVFYPATERDLPAGLQYMSRHNITYLTSSGGHGSTITLDTVRNGVLISLKNFVYVTLNNTDETVAIRRLLLGARRRPSRQPKSKRLVYTINTKQIDIPQIRQIYNSYSDFVAANPLAAATTVLWEVFAQQAVSAQNPAQTAYPNRKHVNILVLVQGTFTDNSVAGVVDVWAKGWRDQITARSGYDKQYVYVNYAHGDEPLGTMYGYEPWRLERLRGLKAKYDPHEFFNHYNPFAVTGKHVY
ncbi:hypothetical protein B0T17DRAFT_504425 [Bombardia bombarda]|uniref:Berberine/berberine-like domain-containing protein n=1 Tax=Bombardia bombarda TaxID=252184 RepID=A0AA40CGV4_9PEZI|nr:hypothetical protein B0T17DRAFT_504425 [Bombardia bombarda]